MKTVPSELMELLLEGTQARSVIVLSIDGSALEMSFISNSTNIEKTRQLAGRLRDTAVGIIDEMMKEANEAKARRIVSPDLKLIVPPNVEMQ